MSLRKANILTVPLDSQLDVAGFRHAGTSLRTLLGGVRIGAGVYEAYADQPIWPYHYHYGIEEWLYVISGAPVLREPSGRRTLSPGDFICFPAGPSGAHTLEGPGRFVLFSGPHTHEPPYMTAYPDSDKVSSPEGILLRSSAVGYWHGEGTGDASEHLEPRTAPPPSPPQPLVNVHKLEAVSIEGFNQPPGFLTREAQFGPTLGATKLGATLYEVDAGERSVPYHYEWGREEWTLVLTGTPTLRHPGGEDQLERGDVVAFPDGPDGAHQMINRGSQPSRLIMFSTKDDPTSIHYPDSGKILIADPNGDTYMFRKSDEVDYWDGEADRPAQ